MILDAKNFLVIFLLINWLELESKIIPAQEYFLNGGGKVVVHKPFGDAYYSAIVIMDGEYPGSGQIAHDVGRSEFILVLDGSFEITINGDQYQIQTGENILIQDGDYYSISGQGRCMLMVHDQPGGQTEIISFPKLSTGESYSEVAFRALNGLSKMLNENETIFVFSHNMTMNAIALSLSDVELSNEPNSSLPDLEIKNGDLMMIEIPRNSSVDDGRVKMVIHSNLK